MINVSWEDANAYVEWLSSETRREYRLPSEAEWEYACRAGEAGRWSFGNDESQLGDHAWFGGNSDKKTHPVGEKSRNAFGLHDMHGNVQEWVEDFWHGSYDENGRPDDGSAWLEGGDRSLRVVRGGSWNYDPEFLRSAVRGRRPAGLRDSIVGFRVARTLSR